MRGHQRNVKQCFFFISWRHDQRKASTQSQWIGYRKYKTLAISDLVSLLCFVSVCVCVCSHARFFRIRWSEQVQYMYICSQLQSLQPGACKCHTCIIYIYIYIYIYIFMCVYTRVFAQLVAVSHQYKFFTVIRLNLLTHQFMSIRVLLQGRILHRSGW